MTFTHAHNPKKEKTQAHHCHNKDNCYVLAAVIGNAHKSLSKYEFMSTIILRTTV